MTQFLQSCILWSNKQQWISMSRAIKSAKSGKRAPVHSGLQIRQYLVKHRRKATGDNPPNKRSSFALENSDWKILQQMTV